MPRAGNCSGACRRQGYLWKRAQVGGPNTTGACEAYQKRTGLTRRALGHRRQSSSLQRMCSLCSSLHTATAGARCAIPTTLASQQAIGSGRGAIAVSRQATWCGRWCQRGLRQWAPMWGGSWYERQEVSRSPHRRGGSRVSPIGFVIP